jgi:hypothetical protein
MVVATIALIVALGGNAVAAFGPFKGDKIIKKRSLSGNRLRNHTLTGTQIDLAKLGVVPNANHATTAGFATSATAAGSAPPSGAAGGDLRGTYPTPAIAAGAVNSTKVAAGSLRLSNLAVAVGNFNFTGGSLAANTCTQGNVATSGIAAGDVSIPAPDPATVTAKGVIPIGVAQSAGGNATVVLCNITTSSQSLSGLAFPAYILRP